MSEPVNVPVPATVHVNPVITGPNYTALGMDLANAGLDQTRVDAILGKVKELCQQASESVALGVARAMAAELRGVHVTSAMTIYQALQRQNPMGGWMGVHTKCANIALQVAQARPTHILNTQQ